MSFWTLYWLSRLDMVIQLGVGMTIMGFIAIVFAVLGITFGKIHEEKEVLRVSKIVLYAAIPIVVIGVLVQGLVPTYKQALTFMGVDYVTHNERVLENTDKAIDVFESYIDQKLNQLQLYLDLFFLKHLCIQ